jgi:RNA polymerase sigma-70 factor (ECF subfamily)
LPALKIELEKSDKYSNPSPSEGNLNNFEALFKMYYAPLVVYACRFVNETDIAREIVQDFFVRLFEKRQTLAIDISIKSYLYRSVYNCCINYINQRVIQDKHLKNIDMEKVDEDNLENEINRLELQQKIVEVIETLPAKCRRIFKMNRLEGLKNEEIAMKLNLSKRTVETQISKALKILRLKLADFVEGIL